MCILFVYNGSEDASSDYQLIVASNRDEFYHRPAEKIAAWSESPDIVAGKDLQGGGTWLGISPTRKKIAALLNMPSSGTVNPSAKTRGKLVTDFLTSDVSAMEYANTLNASATDYNNFILITVEIGSDPVLQTYNNVNNSIATWQKPYMGFSNSLPETPLKKVTGGTEKFKHICSKSNKICDKGLLVDELISFLKDRVSYYPDPVLALTKRPEEFNKALSSVFVEFPQAGYGTRTQSLIILTKTGHMDIIEVTLKNGDSPYGHIWERTSLQYDF